MKYTIDLLENMDWVPLTHNGVPMVFGSELTMLKAVKDNMGITQRIMLDDIVIEFVNGSEHQYKLFKDNIDNAVNKKERYDGDRAKFKTINFRKVK